MPTQKTIGQQILEARKRKESFFTQAQLAEKSGISTFTISALEQSKSNECSTYIIRQLQKALNIKFDI